MWSSQPNRNVLHPPYGEAVDLFVRNQPLGDSLRFSGGTATAEPHAFALRLIGRALLWQPMLASSASAGTTLRLVTAYLRPRSGEVVALCVAPVRRPVG